MKKKENIKKLRTLTVRKVDIYDYCKHALLIFGTNKNLARSIPDGRDGLKLVERRLLFTEFSELGMRPNRGSRGRVKLSRIEGDVIGKFHPHGTSSVYGVIVALCQWWNNYPLYGDPEGNFGSISGDSAAADRYITAGISEFAYDCFFSEWTNNITDFKLNYTGELLEPEVLPAKYPVILFKGSFGMGYALYTGIPPYNVNEACDLVIDLIKNPNKKKVALVPDLPAPCQIVNTDFDSICEKGEGSFRMRGHTHYDEDANAIVITSIPYMVTLDKILDKLKEAVKDHKITGIKDVKDNSNRSEKDMNRQDIKVYLYLEKGANYDIVLDRLYKCTALESTFPCVFQLVNDYRNVKYNLRGIITDWIDFRRDTKHRCYIYKFNALNKKKHVLDTIVDIIFKKNGCEKIATLAHKSKNKQDYMNKLMKEFDLTDLQAESVAGFELYKFSKESGEKFKADLADTNAQLKIIEAKLESETFIDEEIIEELKECKKKYGRKRQCEVININDDSAIEDKDYLITITKNSFIKKMPANANVIGEFDKDDEPLLQGVINNTSSVLVFDKTGKVYKLNIYDVAETSASSIGVSMSTYIKNLKSNIVACVEMPDVKKSKQSFIFVTKNGIVKKSSITNYLGTNKSGLIAMLMKDEDDSLIDVEMIKRDKDIILYTFNGKGIRLDTSDIPETLRMSSGVQGIKMDDGDFVVGCKKIEHKKYIAILTNKGNMKKIITANFEVSPRPSKAANFIAVGNSEKVVSILPCQDEDTLLIHATDGIQEIDVADIKEGTRLAKGKKYIKTKGTLMNMSIK